MKVIFAGTPDFAAVTLQALVKARVDVSLVLTQPDRPKGRGLQLQPSAVKEAALALGLPVEQPVNFAEDASISLIEEAQADVMVVVAYGLILPQRVLDIPKYGCLNIHASLLPRWRGAAPIQRAIEAGDTKTGVGIMQMKAGLDTGDILYELVTDISIEDTALSLHDRLASMGAEAVLHTLNNINHLQPVVQDESKVSYAHKLTKQEAQINWQERVESIERKIRAFNPFPCAWTMLNGKNLKVWSAGISGLLGEIGRIVQINEEGVFVGAGGGSIVLKEVQLAGGKRLPIHAFLQGNSLEIGQMLGDFV